MPIYAYQCQGCGEHFELLVRSDSTPTCPHCGATALTKCVTAPAAPGKSKALLQRARALQLRVIPWTVNEAQDMARLIDWGVDGIITDAVDRFSPGGD